ncbi:MAG: transglycosylase domain-containing protein, partial [Anaerolineae bacterium]
MNYEQGASTITQQLARNVLLPPGERTEQTLKRKIKEAVLAVELTRQYSKNEILEIYLNQIYYGNLSYGIEAASQTYFGKPAADLNLAEAAFLAGLPQSPAVYDPYTNPEGAKRRQEVVLGLMVEAGYITPRQAQAAAEETLNLNTRSLALAAPHFVTYVRAELEANYPADLIYQAGLRIETTLDRRLQAIAEQEVRRQVDALADKNVTNGALVAVQPQTGQILAMVGSKDFRNEAISGQINMAVSPRQPGSSIKPLVYLTAFEQGWTPATLLMDVPVEYPDGAGGTYRPVNYDEKFHGPVSLRLALANSYNIPAVKTLDFVGLSAFKQMATRLGITTLTRNDYGLALALGAGEVPLVQMVNAYQAIANGGVLIQPYAIARVVDAAGRDITPPQPAARRVLSEEHAYLMTHILADNRARARAFGPTSALALSRPAAAKTGTTNDFRDNLVLGYTPDIVAGVWVGNADYTPMVGTTGLSGAGPIWHNFMERAHEGLPARDFTRPPGIIELEVCADSGTIPSEVCPERRTEIFAADQPPLGPEHDIHQLIDIDLNTGKRANEFCRANIKTRYYRVYPPDGREWAISQGIEQPPLEFCPSTAISAQITAPVEGETVRGVIKIEGHALAANFA